MKILTVITTAFVPYGGLTTVAMNYYRNIDRSIFKIDFASTNTCSDGLTEELRESGSMYYKLPNRTRTPFFYMKELYKICKGYDVIHIHGNSATTVLELIPAKCAGIKKRIVHIHNTKSDHHLAHRFLYPLMRRLMTDAVACSKASGEWIFRDVYYTVLNNAIELNRYNYSDEFRNSVRKEYGIERDALVIGHVGKLVEQKNHLFLIDVFKKITEKNERANLLLVGDGVMRKALEEKIKSLGIDTKVFFAGMQENSSRFLSAMDIIAFPSLWEGLPLSLLEAQANGLPCIASDVITPDVNMGGGIADIVIGECLCLG